MAHGRGTFSTCGNGAPQQLQAERGGMGEARSWRGPERKASPAVLDEVHRFSSPALQATT